MTQEVLSLTDQEKARIKKLREAGYSCRSIAQETGISIGSVYQNDSVLILREAL